VQLQQPLRSSSSSLSALLSSLAHPNQLSDRRSLAHVRCVERCQAGMTRTPGRQQPLSLCSVRSSLFSSLPLTLVLTPCCRIELIQRRLPRLMPIRLLPRSHCAAQGSIDCCSTWCLPDLHVLLLLCRVVWCARSSAAAAACAWWTDAREAAKGRSGPARANVEPTLLVRTHAHFRPSPVVVACPAFWPPRVPSLGCPFASRLERGVDSRDRAPAARDKLQPEEEQSGADHSGSSNKQQSCLSRISPACHIWE
jgi:hypothetical protein